MSNNEQPVVTNPQDAKLWKVMESVLKDSLIEQRRRRRWGIFFKIIVLVYFLVFLAMLAGTLALKNQPFLDELGTPLSEYTAVIKIEGTISATSDASADRIIPALKRAFKDPKAKAIILRINSGGGSPVQSGYVYDEIMRLRKLHNDKKVYAVITDIGASGAYYIAAAADEIYADKASLVGSIGVTAASFGFVDTMHKLGVQRRLYTSGEHKAFLDPFSPMKEDETVFWEGVLDVVHNQFIDAVKKGRGDRLKDNPELFSGLIWSGEQAIPLGLIDGLGSASFVAREIVKAPHLVDFTNKDDNLTKFMKKLGVETGTKLIESISEVKLQ